MKILNKHHLEFLKELEKYDSKNTKIKRRPAGNYVGTDKLCYSIKSSVKKQIVQDWLKKHPQFSLIEYKNLLDSLSQGASHEEVNFIGKLLQFSSELRKKLKPQFLGKWLNNTQGWAEVDSICQSKFSSKEMLNQWNRWHKLLIELSESSNIQKRRASLVLLTRPVRECSDTKFANLAFTIINKLKGEREILITKAISWLLRDLIRNHRKKVISYLNKEQDNLPKVAVRETKNKLRTGKK